MKDVVYIGCPTYDGNLHQRAASQIFKRSTNLPNIIKIQGSSALTSNCNAMWIEAMNLREKYLKEAEDETLPDDKKYNLKWFAMCHADIGPEDMWVDKLIAIAEAGNYGMVSCVVPIKDTKGISSTAIEIEGDEHFPFLRISQAQIHDPGFPETFDVASAVDALVNKVKPHLRTPTLGQHPIENINLLMNTGCSIIRLDQEWSDKVYYDISNAVLKGMDGKRINYFFPEDWFVSKLISKEGARIASTRAVKVTHYGMSEYNNWETWGDPIDRHCPDAEKQNNFRQD